tara:strand:- start:120 stop:713 length:594 start_codon:yes stop_codon:yes gene_type:complete
MDNFDLKKYLAEGKLLKEEFENDKIQQLTSLLTQTSELAEDLMDNEGYDLENLSMELDTIIDDLSTLSGGINEEIITTDDDFNLALQKLDKDVASMLRNAYDPEEYHIKDVKSLTLKLANGEELSYHEKSLLGTIEDLSKKPKRKNPTSPKNKIKQLISKLQQGSKLAEDLINDERYDFEDLSMKLDTFTSDVESIL